MSEAHRLMRYQPGGDVAQFSRALDRSCRRLMVSGLVVVLVSFGGLGTWAAVAPLRSAALATGVVKVAGERKTVQHLEGGIVKEILVREDQSVEAGQVLIRLDDLAARARHAQLLASHDALAAEAARLEAERDGRPVVAFPTALTHRRDDPRIASLLDGEATLFQSRRAAVRGQIEVLRQRKQQSEEKIGGRQEQVAAARTQLDYITEEIKGAQTLMEVGMYTRTRFYALKRAEADLNGDLGRLGAEIAETRALNGETDLRILDLQNQFRKDANDRLQEVRLKLADLAERLGAAADALDRTAVVARQAGRVIGLQAHSVGGVIQPGAPILDIVPRDDMMIVEARVRPEDIDLVRKGLAAEVRFNAFNVRTTPVFPGKVIRVSADRFTDSSRGLAFYLAQIEIDPKAVPTLALQPGMPAEVYIVTGERTALEYLTRPIREQLHRALLER